MTPNLPQPSTPTPRIFLHLGRRVALLCTLAVLMVAGSAMAQVPALPAISQGVNTPLGSTTADLKDGALDVCSQNAASTAMLPALPAVPALPVPVAVPALPAVPDAGIAAHACAHADLSQATGAADALPVGQIADQATGQAQAVVEQAQAATGPIQAFVGWVMSLF